MARLAFVFDAVHQVEGESRDRQDAKAEFVQVALAVVLDAPGLGRIADVLREQLATRFTSPPVDFDARRVRELLDRCPDAPPDDLARSDARWVAERDAWWDELRTTDFPLRHLPPFGPQWRTLDEVAACNDAGLAFAKFLRDGGRLEFGVPVAPSSLEADQKASDSETAPKA